MGVRFNFCGKHLVILVTVGGLAAFWLPIECYFAFHKHTQALGGGCNKSARLARKACRKSQFPFSDKNIHGTTFPLIFIVYNGLLKFMSAVTRQKQTKQRDYFLFVLINYESNQYPQKSIYHEKLFSVHKQCRDPPKKPVFLLAPLLICF